MTTYLLNGIRSAFSISPQVRYQVPSNGFYQDAKNMRQDVASIGADMRTAIKKVEHEQQAKKHTSN